MANPTIKSLKAKLQLLVEMAPDLREAGVLSFEVDGIGAVELAPQESELPADLKALLDDANAERDANPLTEAATYGLPDGARLPGFSALIDRKQRDA